MKPVVFEKDGVKVAVAVQVQVNKPAAGGCDCSHDSGAAAGPGLLDDGVMAGVGAISWCLAALRFTAAQALLSTARITLLLLNMLGWLGAVFARTYLLGWARLGGTHRQLSRRISPWLPPTEVPEDLAALTAKVLERPKSIPGPREYAPRTTAPQALAIERRKQLKA